MLVLKRVILPLLVPILVLTLAALALWNWPELIEKGRGIEAARSTLSILPFLPYAIFLITALMGWRYSNVGLVLGSLLLTAAYGAISAYGTDLQTEARGGITSLEAVTFLVPLNLFWFSLLTTRRILSSISFLGLSILLIQVVLLLLFCQWPVSANPGLIRGIGVVSPPLADLLSAASIHLGQLYRASPLPRMGSIPFPALLVYAGAFILLMIRYTVTRDSRQSGFAGALIGVFLSSWLVLTDPAVIIFYLAAGLILMMTTIEASFSMAYVDDLTGLKGRRGLNEALVNLGRKYAIAMIDVDFFKRFNDRYGHKTGDQVLKMIATKLETISGNAKTYRYGGEEFTVIFPGKTAEEALPHLEKYRKAIAAAPFIVRNRQRRAKRVRGIGKSKKRQQKGVRVTISIGVASPGRTASEPGKVLKAADQMLYRAKRAGRNRVMS